MAAEGRDWELDFYSITRLAENELIVSSIPNPRVNTHFGFSSSASTTNSDGQSPDAHANEKASHAPSRHYTQQSTRTPSPEGKYQTDRLGLALPSTIGRGHNQHTRDGNTSSLKAKEKAHNTQLTPTDEEIKRDNFPIPPGLSLKRESKPGWASLDLNRNMFDYLSPSRLLGPPPTAKKGNETRLLRNPQLIYRKKSNLQNSVVYEEIYQLLSHKGRKPHSSSNQGTKDRKDGSEMSLGEESDPRYPHNPNTRITTAQKTKHARPSTYVKLGEATQESTQTSLDRNGSPRIIVTSDGHQIRRPKTKKPTKSEVEAMEFENLKATLKKQFGQYDLNGDGSISRREAFLLLEKNITSSLGPVTAELRQLLDFVLGKMDVDRDQRIEYSEYERCVLEEPLLRGCFGSEGYATKM